MIHERNYYLCPSHPPCAKIFDAEPFGTNENRIIVVHYVIAIPEHHEEFMSKFVNNNMSK